MDIVSPAHPPRTCTQKKTAALSEESLGSEAKRVPSCHRSACSVAPTPPRTQKKTQPQQQEHEVLGSNLLRRMLRWRLLSPARRERRQNHARQRGDSSTYIYTCLPGIRKSRDAAWQGEHPRAQDVLGEVENGGRHARLVRLFTSGLLHQSVMPTRWRDLWKGNSSFHGSLIVDT